jgi:biotin carboxyl carrier protein
MLMVKNTNSHSAGIAHLVLIISAVVILVVAFAAWKVWDTQKHNKQQASRTSTTGTSGSGQEPKPDVRKVQAKDIVMKSVGFNLDTYDAATNKAGDLVFTKEGIPFDQIWGDFGQQDPRSPNDPTKRNPQPTYILPLGTKVQSLIDGYVTRVDKIYSGDMTIWVSPFTNGDKWFETEHISNPIVKVGDKVTSGQVIADVSPHDSQNHPGFGILEVGLFYADGAQPAHACPYQYLDKSVKDDLNAKITGLHKAWEAYIGKDVYADLGTYPVPGCTTLDPVHG